MTGKYSAILAVLCICTGSVHPDVNTNANEVELTVYFESLCPDSYDFFVNQLVPTYEKLSNYMKVNLAPYGKATARQISPDRYEFRCQHGPKECELNKLTACGNHLLRNTAKQIQFDACILDSSFSFLSDISHCAIRAGIDYQSLVNCQNSSVGSKLLNDMGKLTPKLSFVPTIHVNGSSKPEDQWAIRSHLTKYICDSLPNPPTTCRRSASSAKTTRWYDFLFSG